MMKNLIITVVLLITITGSVMAQKPEVEWTFAATYEDSQVALDSIYIENMTSGSRITIYAPATSFSVTYSDVPSITDPRSGGFGISAVYPNPVDNEATLELCMIQPGTIDISISGISGTRLLSWEGKLSQGIHQFKLIPGTEPVYFVSARQDNMVSTAKVVSSGCRAGQHLQLDYTGELDKSILMKSTGELTDFIFKPGDQLKFIGYVEIPGDIVGSDFIIENVEGSDDFTFVIIIGKVCPTSPVVEYGGKAYLTVDLGGYCWLRENLSVGEVMTPGTADMANDGTIERYCYNDDPANCDLYGGLYQWPEAMQYVETSGTRGICPEGWHIPTTLEFYLTALAYGGWGVAGGKMKSMNYWAEPNTGATNETGFTAVPGGLRIQPSTPFGDISNMAYFWSSDGQAASSIDAYWLTATSAALSHYTASHPFGLSVRCLKDY